MGRSSRLRKQRISKAKKATAKQPQDFGAWLLNEQGADSATIEIPSRCTAEYTTVGPVTLAVGQVSGDMRCVLAFEGFGPMQRPEVLRDVFAYGFEAVVVPHMETRHIGADGKIVVPLRVLFFKPLG